MKNMTDVGGLHGWQWVFLLEGLPCVALGIVIVFVPDEHPETAVRCANHISCKI